MRAGMTMVEATVALAVFAVLVVIVAQCITLCLRERTRAATHQAALELAANLLEAARAQPWEELNKAWADVQTVPSSMGDFFPDGKVIMTVEPGQPGPFTRRVTVEVIWQLEANLPADSVQLTTLLSARATTKAGGTP
jgi:Tfp pilus assembly protein PilE